MAALLKGGQSLGRQVISPLCFHPRCNAVIFFAVFYGECIRIIENHPLSRPVFTGVRNAFVKGTCRELPLPSHLEHFRSMSQR